MPSRSGNGGIDLSAADLKELDLSGSDVQRFWAFDFIDDSNEYFGVIDDIHPGDLWYINVQIGYATDDFVLYGVHLEADDDTQVWGGHHDEEGINMTMVFTGSDLIQGGSEPGNADLVIQQADTSQAGQNFQIYVSAVRLTEADSAIYSTGATSNETFDS